MQLAVFFQRELVAAVRFELRHALKAVMRGDIPLADRKVHDGCENGHLDADGGIADDALAAAFSIFPPPQRIFRPTVLRNQMNLCAADISLEGAVDLASYIFRAGFADLARVGAALLGVGIFLRHL